MKQLLLVLGLVSTITLSTGAAHGAAAPLTSAAAIAVNDAPAAAPGGVPPASSEAAAAAKAPAATPVKSSGGPIQVQVVTSLGTFTIELLPERAPLTVAQFMKYVDQGHYSGTLFHRVIPNFVIQGGGYDTGFKLKGTPTKVVNESGNGLVNLRGTVGLARPAEPHEGDCQFYVNLYDNPALDPNQTRWGYAVFGKVVQGMDVVDKIGNVSTGARGPFKEDAPLQQVVIEKVERVAAP